MLLSDRFTANSPIQLNMIAVMTSLTLKNALKMPGIAPQTAPPTMPSSTATYHGSWNCMPATSAKNEPIVYCPDAPMLKSPVLNAKPTERPVIRSGAAV